MTPDLLEIRLEYRVKEERINWGAALVSQQAHDFKADRHPNAKAKRRAQKAGRRASRQNR